MNESMVGTVEKMVTRSRLRNRLSSLAANASAEVAATKVAPEKKATGVKGQRETLVHAAFRRWPAGPIRDS